MDMETVQRTDAPADRPWVERAISLYIQVKEAEAKLGNLSHALAVQKDGLDDEEREFVDGWIENAEENMEEQRLGL